MSIWKQSPDLAAINAPTRERADGLLGIRITEIGADFVRGELAMCQRVHHACPGARRLSSRRCS